MATQRTRTLERMVTAYIDCALWCTSDESTPSGGYPLNRNYDRSDIHPDTLEAIYSDCNVFLHRLPEHVRGVITNYSNELERCGHDLWLTRNGHGAGFWDGDWIEPIASLLTREAKRMGEVNLYVGDDWRIHQTPLPVMELTQRMPEASDTPKGVSWGKVEGWFSGSSSSADDGLS